MDHKEFEQKNIRGISITRKDERAFHCIISFDMYTGTHSLASESIGLVYAKALLAGCGTYTRESFLDAINMLGASLTVGIDRGIVTLTITALDTHRAKLLKLVHTMLLAPTFAQKELRRIQTLLANELQEEKEDAKTQSLYALIDSLYAPSDRRYVNKTEAVIEAVRNVNRKDLQDSHQRAMQSRWIFTTVSKPEDQTATVKMLTQLRSQFADAQKQTPRQSYKPLSMREIKLVPIPSKQNIEINFGSVLPLRASEQEYYAFLFGLAVLGKWGGFAGRLMSTVREKEGLTYGIYARTETVTLTEYGYWRIMTFFAPEKVLQGITSTLREIAQISEAGITDKEYSRFKDILATGYALLHDSIIRTAGDTHASQVKGFSYAMIEEHRTKILAVTKKEVNAALKKYLDPNRLIIAGAGPIAAQRTQLQALRNLAKAQK